MPDLDPHPAYRLTQAQAADLLGVSTARAAELVGQGRLTPVPAVRADAGRAAGSGPAQVAVVAGGTAIGLPQGLA